MEATSFVAAVVSDLVKFFEVGDFSWSLECLQYLAGVGVDDHILTERGFDSLENRERVVGDVDGLEVILGSKAEFDAELIPGFLSSKTDVGAARHDSDLVVFRRGWSWDGCGLR